MTRNGNDDTITLVMDGPVTLRRFNRGLEALGGLIAALENEFAPKAQITWTLEKLEAGSALVMLTGEAGLGADREAAGQVIRGLEQSLQMARAGRVLSVQIANALRSLMGLAEPEHSLRLQTAGIEIDLLELQQAPAKTMSIREAQGAARGKVQSLSSRGRLRFIIYDLRDDHPIACYMLPGSEAQMLDIWGKIVEVQGKLRRSATGERITSVAEIGRIELVGAKGEYRLARGAARPRPGRLRAEELIRRERDHG